MIIRNGARITTLDIWYPRYKDKTADNKEWIVLLADYKVRNAFSVIKVIFTRAKHLKGFEGYIKRSEVLKYPLQSNGTIKCYTVPFNKLERNEVPEIVAAIKSFGW